MPWNVRINNCNRVVFVNGFKKGFVLVKQGLNTSYDKTCTVNFVYKSVVEDQIFSTVW